MKRLVSNIYTRTVLCVLLAAVAVSCTEEKFGADDPVEYGRPVTVYLSYGAPEMQVQTRSLLTEDEEKKVHDLLVVVFDEGKKKFKSEYYDNARLRSASAAGSGHEYSGNVPLTITTGKYYIMGIANLARGSVDHASLTEQLKAVKDMDDFNALLINLDVPGSILRPNPALTMAGGYRKDDSHTAGDEPDLCTVNADGQISGYIHLRRIDSRIKFVIKNDNPSVITQLQPVSWKVFNVPSASYLTEQTDNAKNVGYKDSEVSSEFDNTIKDQSSFEFYMMENKQNVKEQITNSTNNPYHERERKEYGKFKHAPDNATYVEIRMRMQLKISQGDGTTIDRSADVKYTVHLGYCRGDNPLDKANDFFSLRNTKYTYTVKVKGVDKIVVEAKKEGEKQPGAEGLVVDYIGGERILLDAHYSVFNISLTPKEIKDLHYRIKTPFGDYSDLPDSQPFNSDSEDCKWVRFVETTNEKTLVNYRYTCDKQEDASNSCKWLMTIDDLKKSDFAQGSESEDKPQWFTVFVDEYVYKHKAPKEYVNKDARELYIYADSYKSPDGKSTYVKGKYVIAQHSIQTFYDLDNSNSLLGVEHADETKGYNLYWKITNIPADNSQSKNWYGWDGWMNVAHGSMKAQNQFGVVGHKWDEYALLGHVDKKGHPTFQMKKTDKIRDICQYEETPEREYYEILYACLSRNRDENRDGIIQEDELKWYLPTLRQYQLVYMGSAALATPLFAYSQITSLGQDDNKYHFASSDCQKIFAEQGASSNRPNWGNDKADPGHNKWARNLRCVRNLRANSAGTGTDMTAEGISHSPEMPYEHDAKNRIITLGKYNNQCIRTAPVYGYLAAHDNFNKGLNAPYKKFKYAKGVIDVESSKLSDWLQILDKKDICKEYSEEPDGSDKGKWRIPNQTEMMFIWMVDPPTKHCITATSYRYNSERYCVVEPNVCYVGQFGNNRKYSIRPVRDILDE